MLLFVQFWTWQHVSGTLMSPQLLTHSLEADVIKETTHNTFDFCLWCQLRLKLGSHHFGKSTIWKRPFKIPSPIRSPLDLGLRRTNPLHPIQIPGPLTQVDLQALSCYCIPSWALSPQGYSRKELSNQEITSQEKRQHMENRVTSFYWGFSGGRWVIHQMQVNFGIWLLR